MEQMTLFGNNRTMTPLASRVRPDTLDEFVGQEHLLGKGKILRQLIEQDHISSMIFWGTARCGQDDSCQYYCWPDPVGVYQFQCRYKRYQRN